MPRTLHASLQSKLNTGTTNLCHIVTITRTDGQVFRYTDLDVDVTVDGNVYESSNSFQVSAITSSSNNGIQSTNCNIFFSATGFTELDVVKGAYDYAHVVFAVVDYINPEWGAVVLLTGKMSSINGNNRKQGQFELNGLLTIGDQRIGEYYSPECRANLGDLRCKVPSIDISKAGTITNLDGIPTNMIGSFFRVTFDAPDPIDGIFNNGLITFNSGPNSGLSMEIQAQFHANEFTYGPFTHDIFLSMSFPRTPEIGDEFTMLSGCDKRPITCLTKFDNIVNFRGEPFVPGNNYIMDLKQI